jgi:hypothetical protein|tara:strand:- start:611 stop:952 length:342 start_codon:yes stop_codon:yes gene_type:complete
MKKFNLDSMHKGWFVGDFTPSVLNTEKCEVAVKRYKKGDYEEEHYHMECEEITIILHGSVEMNGVRYEDGDIIVIECGESTDFKALTDVTTVVYKDGSIKGDKYLGKNSRSIK